MDDRDFSVPKLIKLFLNAMYIIYVWRRICDCNINEEKVCR